MQDGVVPGHSRRCTDGLAVVRRGGVSPGTAASVWPALRRATRNSSTRPGVSSSTWMAQASFHLLRCVFSFT